MEPPALQVVDERQGTPPRILQPSQYPGDHQERTPIVDTPIRGAQEIQSSSLSTQRSQRTHPRPHDTDRPRRELLDTISRETRSRNSKEKSSWAWGHRALGAIRPGLIVTGVVIFTIAGSAFWRTSKVWSIHTDCHCVLQSLLCSIITARYMWKNETRLPSCCSAAFACASE